MSKKSEKIETFISENFRSSWFFLTILTYKIFGSIQEARHKTVEFHRVEFHSRHNRGIPPRGIPQTPNRTDDMMSIWLNVIQEARYKTVEFHRQQTVIMT